MNASSGREFEERKQKDMQHCTPTHLVASYSASLGQIISSSKLGNNKHSNPVFFYIVSQNSSGNALFPFHARLRARICPCFHTRRVRLVTLKFQLFIPRNQLQFVDENALCTRHQSMWPVPEFRLEISCTTWKLNVTDTMHQFVKFFVRTTAHEHCKYHVISSEAIRNTHAKHTVAAIPFSPLLPNPKVLRKHSINPKLNTRLPVACKAAASISHCAHLAPSNFWQLKSIHSFASSALQTEPK